MIIAMTVAIVGVVGLASWDERLEARAALDDFTEDQASLAQVLSAALIERLASIERNARAMADDGPRDAAHDLSVPQVVGGVRAFERPGDVRVLVRAPERHEILASDGRSVVRSPTVAHAFDTGASSARLARAEAAELMLPARMAIAGIARADAGRLGVWHVAVVATAERERVREERSRARLLLGTTLVSMLILIFGGAAVRRRTKAIELSHALALKDVEVQRDEQLVRADKLATLGALAMGVAHEVSTPLGVILARAEQLASRQSSDDRARRSGEMIVEECTRINEVIRGFLGLARGSAPVLGNARPADLARNAMRLVAHRFAKAGIELAAKLDDDDPVVACDARLFEQVLVNLLLNACEASDRDGRVDLAIGVEDARVSFVVTDEGHGISDEDRARVAAPFFTTKPEGTGLGLAIANEIVKHHRGSLTIHPSPTGRGTQVVVEVPSMPEASVRHG